MFLKRAECRNRTWMANDFLFHIYFLKFYFLSLQCKDVYSTKIEIYEHKEKTSSMPPPKDNRFINVNIFC